MRDQPERCCMALAAFLIVSGCSHRTPSVQRFVTAPSPAFPKTTISPNPEVTFSRQPQAMAAPAPSYAPEGPIIYRVSATPEIARAGDTIVWKVRTTRDVVTVSANAFGVTIPLQRRGPGQFGTAFQIPAGMPAFFRGTYSVGIEARNQAGIRATSQISLRLL